MPYPNLLAQVASAVLQYIQLSQLASTMCQIQSWKMDIDIEDTEDNKTDVTFLRDYV